MSNAFLLWFGITEDLDVVVFGGCKGWKVRDARDCY